MTTLPAAFTSGELHQARQLAQSFGAEADRYDRARPGYPAALAERIVAAAPGREVLDVGIGTGKSALPFLAAGCDVVGVDADDRMAQVARQRGVETEVAKFEDWDPAGRTFALVIAGQAWHWVEPVAGAAKARDILRPGGRLAVFWNVMQFPADIAAAFLAVNQRELGDTPFSAALTGGVAGYQRQLDKAADGIRAAGGFHLFAPEQTERLMTATAAVIDAAGGSFTMTYAAIAVTAAR
jgi:SAM-dependent methyltransferase